MAAYVAQQALVVLAFGLAIILEFDLGEIGELCEELGVAGARHLRNLEKKAICIDRVYNWPRLPGRRKRKTSPA
jgi:hypothetical protein